MPLAGTHCYRSRAVAATPSCPQSSHIWLFVGVVADYSYIACLLAGSRFNSGTPKARGGSAIGGSGSGSGSGIGSGSASFGSASNSSQMRPQDLRGELASLLPKSYVITSFQFVEVCCSGERKDKGKIQTKKAKRTLCFLCLFDLCACLCALVAWLALRLGGVVWLCG